MLAITSSDKCYINSLLDKVNYSKELSPNKTEIYKCNYNSHEFVIMVHGYGKVNIGSSLRYLCEKYPIRVILCVGTCGSITDTCDIFSAVIPFTSLQFDVDFIPNGYIEAQIPKIDKSSYKTNEDLVDCLIRATNKCGINYTNDLIASSDMFVSNYNLASSIRREYNATSVDTETGSVGEYCYINNIEYASIKIVSNFANNNGIKQYNLYDEEATKTLDRITYKFLKEFYEE